MNKKLMGATAFLVVGVGLIAAQGGCVTPLGSGGTGGTTGNTTSSTKATTATTTTSTGMTCPAPTGDTATDCMSVCSTIFDCGITTTCNAAMTQLCPSYNKLTKTAFVNSCNTQCAVLPMGTMQALIAMVDPKSCTATITNVTSCGPACSAFKSSCGN
jgi:hypothetical protein